MRMQKKSKVAPSINKKLDKKDKAKYYLLLFLDLFLLLSILFIHYIVNSLWIIGIVIPYVLLVINISVTILSCIYTKNTKILFNIFVSIISIILLLSNIGNRFALNIELYKAKNKIEKIIENNEYNTKNVYIDNELYAFVYTRGVVDNWTAIVYDNSGLLDIGINLIENNENYLYIEEYNKIKILFGGDLYSIIKLEKNWYLCIFT